MAVDNLMLERCNCEYTYQLVVLMRTCGYIHTVSHGWLCVCLDISCASSNRSQCKAIRALRSSFNLLRTLIVIWQQPCRSWSTCRRLSTVINALPCSTCLSRKHDADTSRKCSILAISRRNQSASISLFFYSQQKQSSEPWKPWKEQNSKNLSVWQMMPR